MRIQRAVGVFAASVLVACGSVGDEPPGRGAEAGAVASDAGLGVPLDAAALDADAGASLDAATDVVAPGDAAVDGCPLEMARIGAFCVDRYEAHVVALAGGVEQPRSPYATIGDASVRAKSAAGVVPQGYISQTEASAACAAAGKRLCGADELARACRGDDAGAFYPYGGTTRMPGKCNEGKGSAMPLLFGTNAALWTYENFNDPRLNQLDGGLAVTGAHPECRSPHGVYDCVGNLSEWSSEPPDARGHGRLRGGFYGDAEINGKGCLYVTSAHEPSYHDYSTGFRCCRDAS